MQPVLLRSNHHARSHESHERNDLSSGEPIPINQVCANQTSSAAKTSFAMHGNTLVLDGDHLMRHLDESFNQWQRGACSVFKDHVHMGDPHSREIGWAVEFRVQSHNQPHIPGGEVRQYILKRKRQLGGKHFGNRRRQRCIFRCIRGNWSNMMMLGRGKGQEVRSHPVEVTHVNTLESLISKQQQLVRDGLRRDLG